MLTPVQLYTSIVGVVILIHVAQYCQVGGRKMEKLLLKPSEVTQILGIGRSLVYELIARKEIPSIRLGRCIRVPSESLQRWLRDQEYRLSETQRQDGE